MELIENDEALDSLFDLFSSHPNDASFLQILGRRNSLGKFRFHPMNIMFSEPRILPKRDHAQKRNSLIWFAVIPTFKKIYRNC